MVGLVLLIALSNVVMLLAARNTTRQREFALRLALGAGRGELFRQLLAESLLLVALGGGLAWMFAMSATNALGAWAHIEASLAPDNTVYGAARFADPAAIIPVLPRSAPTPAPARSRFVSFVAFSTPNRRPLRRKML